MLSTRSELLDKIRLGEDSFLELKEVKFAGGKVRGPTQDDLADELAALANSAGGVLLLGVEDRSREVLGIPAERLDTVEALVRQACEDSVRPPLVPLIERMTLPDTSGIEHPILRVEVPRSLFVHQSPGGYLHRVGSSKRQMPPDYLARLMQQRSHSRLITFDEQLVPGATLATLQEHLWRRFTTPQTADRPEDFLVKAGMARPDEQGVIRATVAGVLMATADPRKWLPNAFIQAVAYRGVSPVPETGGAAYQLDAKDITGPLDEQVADALRFVARNMRVAARKNTGREDLPQFDLTAVFEALVNAVAHRDYSIHGAKIRLRLFADRLELISPGGLPNTMTVESLPYRQIARNEALASLLARCPVPQEMPGLESHRSTLMDRRGEGVSIILDRSERLSGRRPQYRLLDEQELHLTIYGRAAEAKG
ncbi:MAG TPA: ATP-binding protein [Verrucomicrobiota bacterium]|nr:ATP-binding protein [Verrucomicrobiota bacterium]HRT56885.1 ATP-binding protein [Candidatus Paceibacterota bacterium]